ncbi:uncharacterized protein TRAVEDRAFT_31147 [Trametes versicolor FP-101664 SS1]|uniref:uncharacterized protein n=1 Tax=Trametes versicolor (strain FP-101664) TaxID=717944 RepID=UPI00046220FB|nr:uncharacterized protein TRAVEDRAFT_31147 [Trametes versicolor FP-101664 SS1]EIW53887.1 hypothetical protein TRAVEDRAFT_31147 [Trametes versicolor FP-101664 SS1]
MSQSWAALPKISTLSVISQNAFALQQSLTLPISVCPMPFQLEPMRPSRPFRMSNKTPPGGPCCCAVIGTSRRTPVRR